MMRGTTIKREIKAGLALERRMITRRYWFEWHKDKCVGCATCVAICPKEAITLQPGKVENGRLVTRPGIDVDPAKCTYCGECVVLCPVHAYTLMVNGQPEIPVHVWDAFPKLVKKITAQVNGLSPEEAVASVEVCPTDVIQVEGRCHRG